MEILEVLKAAVDCQASDIFLIPGMPYAFKINGNIVHQDSQRIQPNDMDDAISQLYSIAGSRSMSKILNMGDDDFSFSIRDMSRFRANVFRQRGSLAALIRVVAFSLPNPTELNIPETVIDISKLTRGLALVTGPAGSGKSTTLACIIDRINQERNAHVITLEDPIEFLHRHRSSVVTQREIYTDTESYATGFRAALRQSPDVILLGEMRDRETTETAMSAAETGHLIISTLHTIGAANTIDRLIGSFPPEQQAQIRLQISMTLEMVVSQQLLPTVDGKQIPAFEIMILNSAIRNLIRESKTQQIDIIIEMSQSDGMISMDESIYRLHRSGVISSSTAIDYSLNQELMNKKIKRRV